MRISFTKCVKCSKYSHKIYCMLIEWYFASMIFFFGLKSMSYSDCMTVIFSFKSNNVLNIWFYWTITSANVRKLFYISNGRKLDRRTDILLIGIDSLLDFDIEKISLNLTFTEENDISRDVCKRCTHNNIRSFYLNSLSSCVWAQSVFANEFVIPHTKFLIQIHS